MCTNPGGPVFTNAGAAARSNLLQSSLSDRLGWIATDVFFKTGSPECTPIQVAPFSQTREQQRDRTCSKTLFPIDLGGSLQTYFSKRCHLNVHQSRCPVFTNAGAAARSNLLQSSLSDRLGWIAADVFFKTEPPECAPIQVAPLSQTRGQQRDRTCSKTLFLIDLGGSLQTCFSKRSHLNVHQSRWPRFHKRGGSSAIELAPKLSF